MDRTQKHTISGAMQPTSNSLFLAFDFDGTVADTFSIFKHAFSEAKEILDVHAHLQMDEEHMRSLEASELLRLHGIVPDNFPRCVKYIREGMERRRTEAKTFGGMPEVLDALATEGFRLALISSNSQMLAESVLQQRISVFHHRAFDVSLSGKTSAIREAADEWGSSERMWYIGDEIRDLRAAQAAKIQFAAVTWGYNSEASLAKAGCREFLHQPSDIVKLSSRLLGLDFA